MSRKSSRGSAHHGHCQSIQIAIIAVTLGGIAAAAAAFARVAWQRRWPDLSRNAVGV